MQKTMIQRIQESKYIGGVRKAIESTDLSKPHTLVIPPSVDADKDTRNIGYKDKPREIKFPAGHKFALVRPSHKTGPAHEPWGPNRKWDMIENPETSYSTHRDEQTTIAAHKRKFPFGGMIIDRTGMEHQYRAIPGGTGHKAGLVPHRQAK
jgi:hypothetical protein